MNLELIKLLNNASKPSPPPLERDISRELSLPASALLKACPRSFLSTTHCAAPHLAPLLSPPQAYTFPGTTGRDGSLAGLLKSTFALS